jgi:serine/threonine protein kinase
MARVFTITPGLENLGALKSGGQGSVYKAKRTGEIMSAVKILPTPIFSESGDDKNYTDFTNEVAKLRKVNEEPNPHVVTILNHGLTESGSFPFIEMEFIEGPDLEELLKPPHDKVFSVRQCIKVAEQLSSALAHCHKVGVKHGDVKSNNVKFNRKTGNYILLDFGLAVLSDEQRRTSLRRAGAVEFMAPEQTDGVLLFESDVYGFGVILFELIAGAVPFPLTANSDSARNNVLLAHRESAVPNMKELRMQNAQKKEPVPDWLIQTVYKCLEKSPGSRFKNGVELHDHICRNTFGTSDANNELFRELDQLRNENSRLRDQLATTEQTSMRYVTQPQPAPVQQPIKRRGTRLGLPLAILGLLALIVGLLVVFGVFKEKNPVASSGAVTPKSIIGQYQVSASQAYFHNKPRPDSKQQSYLMPSRSILQGLDEENGFIYTEFTNAENKTVKGWLKKTDLRRVEDVPSKTKSKNVTLKEADVSAQLQRARTLARDGDIKAALYIYDGLADMGIPEGMFESGNFMLQNVQGDNDCRKGYNLIKAAAEKGYTPAKRTLGLLYSFSGDAEKLRQLGYPDCGYRANVSRGATFLTEAALEGDTAAKRYLQLLSEQQEQ